MITARDYQQRGIDTLFEQHAAGSKGTLLVSPTGSGKTLIAALAADRWLQEGTNRKVLIIAHERQLVFQLHDEIKHYLGIDVGIEMGSLQCEVGKVPDITVACRASLQPKKVVDEQGVIVPGSSRLYKFPSFHTEWLVIIDEGHRWAWKLKSCAHIFKHFEKNPKSIRLGLTATPMRGDNVSLREVFPDVALDYRLYDLGHGPNAVDDGWAVPYDQRFIKVDGVDFTNLKEVGGDFDAHELESVLSERRDLLSLVRPTLDLCGDKRTIIFSPTVAMSKAVANCICGERKSGDIARHLDGTVPDGRRQQTYSDHQRGAFQFLSVCGLCREGYNDPAIEAVAVYRPTRSLGLAEQMKGRGCRPLRGIVDGLDTPEERLAAIKASAKPDCMVIDLVGITGMGKAATTAHILNTGKPDEIAERAMEYALAADGEIDLMELLEKSEEEIEAEKAEKEKKRLELAALIAEREKADKALRIEANVRYTQRRVEQGHGGTVDLVAPRTRARMLFGKYAGQSLCDPTIPDHYLEWAEKELTRMPQWWMGALRKEMRYRGLLKPKAPPVHKQQNKVMEWEDNDNMADINRILQEV